MTTVRAKVTALAIIIGQFHSIIPSANQNVTPMKWRREGSLPVLADACCSLLYPDPQRMAPRSMRGPHAL